MGIPLWRYSDCRWRFSWKVHPAAGAGNGCIQPHRRRRKGICYHRCKRCKAPLRGLPQHQQCRYLLFIHDLPGKSDTTAFSTADASGSTSQAANVIEGIESGTSLFLIDEDTSATNFMVRDELMQRVVADSEEPITPFISRVRDLYEAWISSILVAGSSGSIFMLPIRSFR